jgi:hypothetical protein
MSYSLSSNLVPVEWLLAELWPLNLYFCSNFKLSRLFLDVLWYIDLIISKDVKKRSGQRKIWTKNTSSRAITQPKVNRPERNSNLNCNSSRYSHIPNIKSIYQRTSRKSLDKFKFEFRSGRMTFGWVMALELEFFVQIWSCPDFSLKSFDILTWYLEWGYI